MTDVQVISVSLTPELVEALDNCRGSASRSAQIETILRRSGTIRQSAQELGIEFVERGQWGGARQTAKN